MCPSRNRHPHNGDRQAKDKVTVIEGCAHVWGEVNGEREIIETNLHAGFGALPDHVGGPGWAGQLQHFHAEEGDGGEQVHRRLQVPELRLRRRGEVLLKFERELINRAVVVVGIIKDGFHGRCENNSHGPGGYKLEEGSTGFESSRCR